MSHPPLEVPVFGASAALHALQANLIHRLELNRQNSYPQGGLTPTLADLHRVLHEHHHHATPPLRIMIRPRGPPPDGSADFLYSDDELVAMREQIGEFVESGLMRREQGDGFVFGVLAKSGDGVVVDVDKCRELVQLAAPWPCVFHRAFVSYFLSLSLSIFFVSFIFRSPFSSVDDSSLSINTRTTSLGARLHRRRKPWQISIAASSMGFSRLVGQVQLQITPRTSLQFFAVQRRASIYGRS